MALPTSRNTPYTPADAVKSNDLNDTQDCIIGHKHPEMEFPIDGSAFRPLSGSPAYNGSRWETGPYVLHAPIYRPIGTRITRVKFAYERVGSETVTISLLRKPVSGAAWTNVATYNDNISGVVQYHELVTNHVMLSGYLYAVSIISAGVSVGAYAYGASLFGDRL